MELKEGYKQTEAGIIPKDWNIVELNKLSEKIMVGIASSATHAYRESGVVMFRNQNIKPNMLDDSDILHIHPDYELLFKNKRLKEGDLLTARTGYPGTTCKVPKEYEGSQSFTTLITRIKPQSIDSDYLCKYLNSEKGKLFFEQNQIGGGQKNVNAGTLQFMPIPLPPTKAEQTAIATVLSDMDNLITGLEKLIEKKKAIKQGAMQELLRPKEGWVVKKLGEIFTFFSTSNYSKAEMSVEGDIGCIHYGLIHAIVNTNYSLSKGVKYYVTNEQAKYERIKDGDVIMVDASEDLIGLNKSIEISDVADKEFIAGLHTFHLRDENSVFVKHFKGLVLNSEYIKNQMLRLAVGMKVFGVSKPQLQQILVPVPPIEVQVEIANILTIMDNEIEFLESNFGKYKSLKQGMMQELLTGKKRLV